MANWGYKKTIIICDGDLSNNSTPKLLFSHSGKGIVSRECCFNGQNIYRLWRTFFRFRRLQQLTPKSCIIPFICRSVYQIIQVQVFQFLHFMLNLACVNRCPPYLGFFADLQVVPLVALYKVLQKPLLKDKFTGPLFVWAQMKFFVSCTAVIGVFLRNYMSVSSNKR